MLSVNSTQKTFGSSKLPSRAGSAIKKQGQNALSMAQDFACAQTPSSASNVVEFAAHLVTFAASKLIQAGKRIINTH